MLIDCDIVDKVNGILNEIQAPRFLHQYGPRTYALWQHAIALFLKEECQLSYRRVSNLLNGLGHTVPTYSALAKMRKRIPLSIWRALLKASAGKQQPLIVGVDATFYSKNNASYHYLKRTKKRNPRTPIQVTALRDLSRNKWLGLRIHSKQVGEAPQAIPLLKQSQKPLVFIADKAYDAEYIHKYCYQQGILTQIPKRKTTKRGFYRKKQLRFYRDWLYHRRSLAESGFSGNKRRGGSHVKARKVHQQKRELYARYIAHNLELVKLNQIFN